MVCLWCVYGVFPGNLWTSHNLNPLFTFPTEWKSHKIPWFQSPPTSLLWMFCLMTNCCCLNRPNAVCPSAVIPNLSWGVLGSAISLSCCEKTAVTAWVLPGENMVKTTVGWSSYYWNDYRFIHPITDEIPMITGLVFTGKFTPEPPIFNGKNHGFRLRFSQEHQPKSQREILRCHGYSLTWWDDHPLRMTCGDCLVVPPKHLEKWWSSSMGFGWHPI